MFLQLFQSLRTHGVPASLREYLSFLAALDAGLATYDVDGFYYLARATLVKNETHLDRFDRAFAASFSGIEAIPGEAVIEALDLPEDLAAQAGREASQRSRKGRDRSPWRI